MRVPAVRQTHPSSNPASNPASKLLGNSLGVVAFASPEAQLQKRAELLGDDVLVVMIPPLGAALRGHLAEHIDERIERELAARGAPSPYLATWSAMPEDAAARLADQLFRARTIGTRGIAIMMGSMVAAGVPALSPEDGATLRLFATAAASAPVALFMDDADVAIGAYADPVPLELLLGAVAPAEPCESLEPPRPSDPPRAPEAAERAEPADASMPPHASSARRAPNEAVPPAVSPIDETDPEPLVAATVGVPVVRARDAWRSWALALGAMRGPQPLAAFERLFVESYVPLSTAIAAGLDDPRAVRAYDEFRRSFERAYTDAFATFGATNRRPRLVMDAHDLAARQGRLHNARNCQVLMVDALRFDLGAHVRDVVAGRGGTLVGESVLWSALPTTTLRQLETIARGIDALRAPFAEEPIDSLRGRGAEQVRRLRVGSRELYKLDLIPTLLGSVTERARAAPEGIASALAEIAEITADSVTRHLQSVPPRTLVLVVGDHGFVLDRRGRYSDGGASPEEVLVPAYAWLVGDLH